MDGAGCIPGDRIFGFRKRARSLYDRWVDTIVKNLRKCPYQWVYNDDSNIAYLQYISKPSKLPASALHNPKADSKQILSRCGTRSRGMVRSLTRSGHSRLSTTGAGTMPFNTNLPVASQLGRNYHRAISASSTASNPSGPTNELPLCGWKRWMRSS